MSATAAAPTTWRPRINPSNISSANASMPPHPPQGYQGPWPPPPPPGYPGPPPAHLPASVSVNQWSKGYWRLDPKATGWSSASGAPPQPPPQQQYYNPGTVNNNVPRPASQQAGGPPGWNQAWIPHPGWQMPADHNPYKRMPKEPDPSYFSVELSENPLGLENMHITYVYDDCSSLSSTDHRGSPPTNPVFFVSFHRRASRPQEKPFTTPWRWVPEDLPPSDDEEEAESTPPSDRRGSSSHDGPNSTRYHHVSSASQQVLRRSSQDSKTQPSSGLREVEQYRRKGVKSPPIRESDQQHHRPENQPPPATPSPPKQGHSNSSSTVAYSSSSRRNTREHTPPQDSSLYRSHSRRNTQEYTPPSDSSPRRSSRKNAQEYTPPSDDQGRPSAHSKDHTPDDRGRRERDKEKDRRKALDSDEHEAFSGRKELHPTFSPAIVRTPKYYLERTSTPNNTPTKSSSLRHASDGPGVPPHGTVIPPLSSMLPENVPSVLSPLIGATPRPGSATIPGLDKISRGELSSSSSSSSPSSSKDRSSRSHSRNHSRSNSLSKSDDKPHRSLQRSDTITSRTMSPTRYDERPQPPTYYSSMSASSLQQSSRTVGRSQTFPSLDPVSENPYLPTRRDSHDGRETRNPPTSISRASDAVKDMVRSSGRTVGRSHTVPRPSHNPNRATSPLRTRSPTRALSPPRSATPSRSSSRAPSRSHTPTGVVVPPGPVPPLPADASHRYRTSTSAPRKVRVRQGLWNRRGDCATADGRYFIRAPPEHQNPADLAHLHQYHFSSYDGRTIPWDQRMKEYPDSMSRRGQPPRYPYEYVRGPFTIADYLINASLQFLKYVEVNESDIRTPEFPSPY